MPEHTTPERVERWDDTLRTYTEWDAAGVQTSQRAYTPAENAAADARAAAELLVSNEATITTGIANDLAVMQAIIAQTNADLKTDPSQEIKDIARAVRRLDRKVARLLDSVD
jgi:hypothetical protein